MTALPDLNDSQLMDICTLFLKGAGPVQTQKACNKLWKDQGLAVKISREQVNRAVQLAVSRGYLRLAPPYEEHLAQRFEDRFQHPRERIHIASVRKSLDHVVSAAVDVVLGLIDEHAEKNRDDPEKGGRVHLGLGAGRTNMLFAQLLAQALREKRRKPLPPLAFHALTSGFDAGAPEKAPDAFFGYFQNIQPDLRMIGLFGPPLVKASEFKKARQRQITRDSFDQRDKIDIVVTALASYTDPHGDLKRLVELASVGSKEMDVRAVVGDVQYCPFDAEKPVKIRSGLRAMTLFEIDELVERVAAQSMDVVLVSGPCRVCDESRYKALTPLVKSPKLKMWSHIVTDLTTAEKVLDPPPEA